ncbi:hypothetical protein ACUN9Y_19815 [Halomonas sp. V046]|uniref:hypothetical protein n=1 Tax=Halomonas sp. V046 TaxID=3459611 RepID=UPI004045005B
MAPKKKRTISQATILIVVEGYVEKAFVSVLRSYYSKPGCKVNINNRCGGSSDSVVNFACAEESGNEIVAAVFDADVPLSAEVSARSRRCGIIPVISTPSIEGTLLDILEVERDNNTKNCKRLFKGIIGEGKTTYKGAHKTLFPKSLIDRKRSDVKALNDLISAIERKK